MQFLLQNGDRLGSLLSGIGTIGLCLLAIVPILVFLQRQHTAKGEWLFRVFGGFYLNEHFDELRELFEYHFETVLAPVMEKYCVYCELLTDAEIALLRRVDTLLNYLEYVLFLEKNRFIEPKYRNLIFSFWFKLMRSPSHVFLRDYLTYDFENLCDELKFPLPARNYLAVYGTLSSQQGAAFAQGQLSEEIRAQLIPSGEFRTKGTLYDLGEFPGFVPRGDTVVHGQLLEFHDLTVLRELDRYEEYDPQSPQNSQFVRRYILLDQPATAAWIYIYNEDPKGAAVLKSGRWQGPVATEG